MDKITYYLGAHPIHPTRIGFVQNTNTIKDEDIFITNISQKEILNSNNISYLENEYGSYTFSSDKSERSSVYFVFNVCAEKEFDVFLLVKTYVLCKLWVNDRFIGMGHNSYSIRLKKGNNIFVFEHYCLPKTPHIFSCRISNLQDELNYPEYGLQNDNYSIDDKNLYVVNKGNYLCNGENFEFLITTNDDVYLDKKQTVKYRIYDYSSGRTCFSGETTFLKKESISTKELYYDDKIYDHFVLEIDYRGSFDVKKQYKIKIFIQSNDINPKISEMIDKILKETRNTYDTFLFQYFKSIIEPKMDLNIVGDIYDNIMLYNNGKSPYSSLKHKGKHYIYFKSKLDNQIRRMTIFVSENTDNTKALPLYLHFLAFSMTNECWKLKSYPKVFISADIYSLGFTSGSYIGEAYINEAIGVILKLFNIDKTRIYASGWSNGATALWSQVTYYPHRYAAVHFLSGRPMYDLVENISGKTVINTISDKDNLYQVAYKAAEKKLYKYCDHKTIDMLNLNHGDLYNVILKKNVLDKLFEITLDPYPRNISFETQHMFHNESYWVRIDGITFGKTKARIKAHTERNIISIRTLNVTSFTINIPPYISRERFEILVNGKSFLFQKYYLDEISFKRNYGFQVVRRAEILSEPYKGLGLLYVYLNPLTIYCPNTDIPEFEKVALSFSKPTTNGFNSNIDISYPIVHDEKDLPDNGCIIVIDNNSNDPFHCDIRNMAPIRCDENGYTYNGKTQECKYCIMQLVKRRGSEKDYILYINTNDTSFFKKNFFTRKVAIPAYFIGQHPFLNNAALIFSDETYKAIYEYGMEEKIIQS